MSEAAVRTKKRVKKNVAVGICHIHAPFNNVIITFTDAQGNTISTSSSGAHGFKGSRKSTPHAAGVTAEAAGRKAQEHGMKTIQEVRVKGPGAGREAAIRALQSIGFNVISIKDITPVPHNGCRPRKRRRV